MSQYATFGVATYGERGARVRKANTGAAFGVRTATIECETERWDKRLGIGEGELAGGTTERQSDDIDLVVVVEAAVSASPIGCEAVTGRSSA